MSDEPTGAPMRHLGADIIVRTRIHALADAPTAGALTRCGIAAGPGPLGLTGDEADVTCQACRDLSG